MGIKEKLNGNPPLAAGLAAGLIVIAVAFAYTSGALGGGSGSSASDRAFFTTDEGKTWFEGPASSLPPFDQAGKTAVRAYVYECKGKRFVNHLERWTPEGKKLAQQAAAQPGVRPAPGTVVKEIKRPGSDKWVSSSDIAKAGPILNVRCPDGGTGATLVEP